MDDPEKIYISNRRPKIESWQKEVGLDGETEFSHDVGDVSLYSYNMAMASFPVGSYVLLDDVVTEALHIEISLTLNELVDRGLASMSWNAEIEKITYNLTAAGEQIHNDLNNEQNYS